MDDQQMTAAVAPDEPAEGGRGPVVPEGVGRPAGRRRFLAGGVAAALGGAGAAVIAAPATADAPDAGALPITGSEHWVTKPVPGRGVRLYVWRKRAAAPDPVRPPVLLVHGSSTAGRASYDLQVPGKPDYSAMDWFARRGYDLWCPDLEGYGRSDKSRPINADVANGADDLEAVTDYITKETGASKVLIYGMSSGALRAGLFAQRHPERVERLALDALVWTGEGSPTLTERRKRLDQWRSNNRRPLNRALVESIFTRDHPGTADPEVIQAFADALIAQDDSVPTGTYLDMSANLPVIDPRQISVPTLVMRGQFDGIATLADVMNFFALLPNPDRQFALMPGIAHSSMHEKNRLLVLHILEAFFNQPPAIYRA
jgi:pimeloyl-ACP methyl ester carboxylesterase